MLGQDVIEACARAGHEPIGLGRGELDITDGRAVDEAFAAFAPDVAINCAAWTDVDGAEDEERAAMQVNSTGAGLVSSAAAARGTAIVHVSSDYVFDGKKGAPYVESDQPAAISAYGRSKQAGETSVVTANPRHHVVRSSWLYGLGGANFVETMLRLASEQPEVLVVNDQIGCPTYTRHLAGALVELAGREDYGIHHVAAAGRCSWFEFAQEIYDQEGIECRVMAASTEMLARKAPRPRFSALDSEHPDPIELPSWRRGLSEYLSARRAPASVV
jgi:dTDP-4-dehydrorhamnose reductase